MRRTDALIAKETARLQAAYNRHLVYRVEVDRIIESMTGKIPDFQPAGLPEPIQDELWEGLQQGLGTYRLHHQVSFDELLTKYPDLASASPVTPDELRIGLSQGTDSQEEQMRYFAAQFQADDELWYWEEKRPGLWGYSEGYVILRSGKPIDYIVTGSGK